MDNEKNNIEEVSKSWKFLLDLKHHNLLLTDSGDVNKIDLRDKDTLQILETLKHKYGSLCYAKR